MSCSERLGPLTCKLIGKHGDVHAASGVTWTAAGKREFVAQLAELLHGATAAGGAITVKVDRGLADELWPGMKVGEPEL